MRRTAAGAKSSRVTELSILAIGATLLAPYAIAQEQDAAAKEQGEQTTAKSDDAITEVLVTGIRKALQTSQEIKKEGDTVIDSITASDIGAFPDKSVAEALQRVTGITVNRFAASGDTTHFSAEPSGVIIRGLPQVRSEFNGRDSFNANSSRGLSFGDVSPELMAGVDTYKNATADMIEGGIAGTINLRTHVPFDSQGFVLAVSGDVGYGDLSEDVKPSGSLIISDRWDTGVGEIGLMANVAYSQVVTESQGTQIGRFFNNQNVADFGGGTKWVPDGVDIRDNVYDRTRTGMSFAGQWQSPEDKVLATLQHNRSKYTNTWNEFSLTSDLGASSQTAQDITFSNATAFAPRGTSPYEFDSNGVFMRGTLADTTNAWNGGPTNNLILAHPNGFASNTGHTVNNGPDGVAGTADDFNQPNVEGQPMDTNFLMWGCGSEWAPDNNPHYCGFNTASTADDILTRGSGLGADTRYSTQTNITEDTSLNLKFSLTERIGLNVDVQYVESTVHNFDNSMNNKTFADTTLDLSHGKPRFSFAPAQGYGFTAGAFGDPQNWFHEWTMEHTEDSEGTEFAARADLDIKLGDGEGWLDSLRVGVRRADRDQDINWSTYNWGAVRPLWGLDTDDAARNAVPFFLNDPRWAGTYVTNDMGSSLVGGGVFGGGAFLHPDPKLVRDYAATLEQFWQNGAVSNSWVPLGERSSTAARNAKCDPDPNSPGGLYCPIEMQSVSEVVDAAYVMLKFGGDDTKIGNISVRGNVGVRWVKTEVGAEGGIAFPSFTRPSLPAPGATGPFPILALTPDDDVTFMNGQGFEQSAGGTHTSWLPSLNLRFGVTDNQFVRLAASRALGRPDMGLYKNYLGVSLVQPACGNGTVTYSTPGDCTSTPVAYTPAYTADSGNPGLAPTTADQLDLTWEWYFSDTGSLTAAVFMKQFNDYIQYGSFVRQFTNNGITRDVSVRGPITGDGAKLRGFEVAYQSFMDWLPGAWSGLGYQLNYTYVDNQGITNANLSTVSGGGTTQQDPLITFTDLPLADYSKSSYNIVAMYDRGKWSARLAYNWRDKFLQTQSDCCIKLPIWQDAYGQLDGSLHFKPSESWDLFLDAQNLLQAETVLKQQVTNDGMLLPRSWFVNDRRVNLGVRYRFQ
ncbi:MAG TPA: TonB-dependent receptor [Steroidobacteraceae bacterium]|nr:TonB-dependent receptor [Steroidobacteraceae bacterium]